MELKRPDLLANNFHSQFLSAAIRSWMVNHLLDPDDTEEIFFLFLELGHEPDESFQNDPGRYLKREMSLMAAKSTTESQETLVKICEGIVQFYLVRCPNDRAQLDHLNALLPINFAFSAHDGHIISVDPDLKNAEPIFVEKPLIQETLIQEEISVNPNTSEMSASEAKTMIKELSRQEQFKQIRQRRLALLKEWEKPND